MVKSGKETFQLILEGHTVVFRGREEEGKPEVAS